MSVSFLPSLPRSPDSPRAPRAGGVLGATTLGRLPAVPSRATGAAAGLGAHVPGPAPARAGRPGGRRAVPPEEKGGETRVEGWGAPLAAPPTAPGLGAPRPLPTPPWASPTGWDGERWGGPVADREAGGVESQGRPRRPRGPLARGGPCRGRRGRRHARAAGTRTGVPRHPRRGGAGRALPGRSRPLRSPLPPRLAGRPAVPHPPPRDLGSAGPTVRRVDQLSSADLGSARSHTLAVYLRPER